MTEQAQQSTFTFNFSGESTARKPQQNNDRPASAPQKQLYAKMCMERGIRPADTRNATWKQVDERIQKMKLMITPNQINTIRSNIEELIELGAEITQPTDEYLRTLERDTTASEFISTLFKMKNEYNDKREPSEKQLETMVQWYACPDIPFEEYNVTLKIELEGGQWTRPTPEQFAEQLRTKLTRKDASELMSKYSSSFYEWRRTRITKEQMALIRQLEERLANLYTPKQVETAISPDGELIVTRHATVKSQYNPVGYTPMDEVVLLMYSKDDAGKLIEQMQYELSRKQMYQYGQDVQARNFDSNGEMEQRDGFFDFEDVRRKYGSTVQLFEELNNIMYSIQAMAGYEIDELQDEMARTFFESDVSQEQINEIRNRIKGHVSYMQSEGYLTNGQIMTLCEQSEAFADIMFGL